MFTSSRVKLLVVTCAALFMAMLDNLVIGVALPSIQESFHAGMSDLEWFMNAYTLAFAVLLIPFSVLGERFGRKRMFLTGIVLFTLGSAMSGISESSIQLILARALQGVGGAAIVPLSLTLVNGAFPPDKRAAALGIWSGISGLGLSVGPLVGGLIVNGAPWQLIFWVNVPVGIVAFLLGMRWLPETRGDRKPIDPLGIALLGAGLFGIVFGLERGNTDGWSSATVISLLAGGVVLLALFYLWERSRKRPFVQFELFRSPKYSSFVIAGFWMNAGIFCAIFLLTLFLQQAQGFSALEAGVREMAWTGCTMLAAPLAGLAVGKLGTRAVLTTGLLLQTGALLGFGLLIANLGVDFPFGYMLPFMMMAGAGMGLSFTPLSHGLLSSVPESAAGEASGMSNAMRELGGVFGIAIGGLVFQSGAAVRTPADFGDHIVPALFAGAAMIAISLLSVIAVRGRHAARRAQAANDPA
ncbi:drug resistance transporter, EmrB/QacA subfamily [Paenibacillus sp. UNC496MF]|uniref:MFS transporter n=1 Tax=Paenibacillus sp. UNC496MF TaxID=1502753 RepID=UPI0008F24AF7|nr:MFS transporter [Paenibacillus sp. UNC496MF]SFJ40823.1 drug resistance transporter, EmrB/QacA subfamily [Paenibacillus sp. UNC496MF]